MKKLNTDNQKNIVLVGIESLGHHTAFMRLFAQTLLDLGYHVIVLFPETILIKDWLNDNHPEIKNNCTFYKYKLPNYQSKIIKRFDDAINVWKIWKNLSNQLRQIEKEEKLKIDVVFFTWLDSYLANYLHPIFIDFIFPYKWSGLYFHPRHLRINSESLKNTPSISDIDILLKSKKCMNITIHDEGIIERYTKRIDKPVILFPEIADDSIPDNNHHLVKSIKEKSKNRLVIGLSGFLNYRQGFLTLLEISKIADKDKYFFVFAGPKNFVDISEEDEKKILSYVNTSPENCFFHFDFLKEGTEFNSIFNTFDIVFLVYNNFASSSNRLTKAAIFHKYVIAQNRFCVGEDVKKYNLGLTIEEGNVEQGYEAIKKIENMLKENNQTAEFEKYRKIHSIDTLKEKFIQVLK